MCLDVEVDPNMPRTESNVVSEGNDPFPHGDYGPSGLTKEEIYRVFAEELDKCLDRKIRDFTQRFKDMEEENKNTQRLAGLHH